MLKDIFEVYRNRLIDLSTNNRAIFLPKLVQQQMIDLKDFHFLNGHPAFNYIAELLGRKRNIPLIRVNDARDKYVNQLSGRIKRLVQHVKFTEEESGERSLYVGWPFVEGRLLNDQLLRCPLIFFPVNLEREDDIWYLRKPVGEHPFLNPSFLLAYAHAQGKDLSKEWIERPLEDFSKDPRGFRTDLYHHLNEELVLDFNREIYQDRLEIFLEQSREYFEGDFTTGKLKLQPYAVLGQFSQKASFLMDDYDQLISTAEHPSLDLLFEAKYGLTDTETTDVREDNLYNTLPLDASQEHVVRKVKEGFSCVVQGPPGTGKSQLICNLVSDFISRGKKVLVVSQKRAAVDVVYERLVAQGFGSFSALVHDFRADRKDLYRKIVHQIGSLENYTEFNRSINSMQLERSFSQCARAIEKHREFFDEYRQVLYDTAECGVPVKELYLTTNIEAETVSLGAHFREFRFGEMDVFLHNFREFFPNYKKYDNNTSFWFHRVDFSWLSMAHLDSMENALRQIADIKAEARQGLSLLQGEEFDHRLIHQSFEQYERLQQLRTLTADQRVFDKLLRLMALPRSAFDLLWLENKADTVTKLLNGEGVEWYTDDKNVESAFAKAIHLHSLMATWLGRLEIRIRPSKYLDMLRLLELNDLPKTKAGVARLMEKLENRLNLNHQYTLLQKEWIDLPKKPFEASELEEEISLLDHAIRARFIMDEIGPLASVLYPNGVSYGTFYTAVSHLVTLNERGITQLPEWKKSFSDVQINHLLGEPDEHRLVQVRRDLRYDVAALVPYDKLKGELSVTHLEVMKKLIDAFPSATVDKVINIFMESLKREWMDYIESKYPLLREVSRADIKLVIEEFQQAVEEKDKISRFIVELRLREEVCRDLVYNRLNNRITYRDLNHQVGKKKSIWPIKKLVQGYSEEVFKLIPCWLASPETVSAIFPMEDLFDLVIFDEASQCYFERAFPAMLRGRQVVVAGDSKQLQPVDLYKIRIQSEVDQPDLELDSLLDIASRYFPVYWLTTHYRSRFLPLVHFSNREFYEDRLAMVPEMTEDSGDHPLMLIRCAGVWQNQMNTEEAAQVVIEVRRLRHTYPNQQIGVITFNYFQMVLVMEMLEEADLLGVGVKVRNIENVQGDEFDFTVFSIGYAANPQGKFTANFGLLARQGGENRLNVAVTRARSQVIVISSIGSADFKENQMKNRGVKALRDYLQYVENVSSKGELEISPLMSERFGEKWAFKEKLLGNYGNHQVRENAYQRVMDLEVVADGVIQAAILTDDQRFFDSAGAKESLVYHPRLLKQKKWNIIYLFTRQYWADREDLLQTKLGKPEL